MAQATILPIIILILIVVLIMCLLFGFMLYENYKFSKYVKDHEKQDNKVLHEVHKMD